MERSWTDWSVIATPKHFLADFNAALKGRDPVARAKDRVASAGTNDPMTRMSHGHSLEQKGKDAEALEEYLVVFRSWR